MSNPFHLQFTLIQHTPLLHFQHDQEGATLRATEIKPKLDKFLITKFIKEEIEYKNWLVGKGEHEALDFQIKFTSDEGWSHSPELPKLKWNGRNMEVDGNKVEQFPCFFGNMGEENKNQPKLLVYDPNDITATIVCMHFKLKEHIKSKIAEFFFSYNFGTRQSKGFGSFSVAKIEKENVPGFKLPYFFKVLPSATSSFNIRFQNLETPQQIKTELGIQWNLFKHIELFHKAIKSGYNDGSGRGYVKSAMFLFCDEKKIQWDKRTIKREYIDSSITQSFPPQAASGNHYLMRDILGLAVKSEWKKSPGSPTIVKESKEVDRFKSPIHYIPVRQKGTNIFNVYISFSPIKIFNKSFEIKKNNTSTLILETPRAFSLKEYFDFLKRIDIDEWIEPNQNADVKMIEKIFHSFQQI